MSKQDLELSAVQSRIYDLNADYYGVDMSKVLDQTGKQIAQKLIHRYGIAQKYAVICGMAGNGADGLAVARHLASNGCQVTVYLIGRANALETNTAHAEWAKLKAPRKGTSELSIKQDVFAQDIEISDVILEALVGTGLHGKVTKRYRDVVKRISHFKQPIIAIDQSIPGYKPTTTISLNSPKSPSADVITVEIPTDLKQRVGPGDVLELYKPHTRTHKLQNGRLLIWYGGMDSTELNEITAAALTYHVQIKVYAPFLAGNHQHLLAEEELEPALCGAEALLCCRQSTTFSNKALIAYILHEFPRLKYVFDDSVLNLVEILEYSFAHNLMLIADKPRGSKLTRRICSEQDVYVNMRGFQNLLWGDNPYSGDSETRINVPQQRNELKLLGLSGAYATKNPIWLAMCAAEFNSGL